MKVLTRVILGVVYALVISLPVTSVFSGDDNRLTNADFEEGNIGGWAMWAVTGGISLDENHTRRGICSANPSLNVDGGPFECGGLIQEFEDFDVGDTVYTSVWIKTDDLRGPGVSKVYAILKLEFWDGDSMIIAYESDRVTKTADWKKVSVQSVVPEDTTKVKCVLILWNDSSTGSLGNVYFDDAYMGTSPEQSVI
ncbi:MAG: hypothetical protein U9Q21_00215 [Candidatus Auribacterota bacterium]|nr:hypothetical protein [Candidatus Auribacterota bacterium]